MSEEPQGVQILEEPDEDREPSSEEVQEYAEFLGIDCAKEPHLMWIAKEGVVAKVPHPWKACIEGGGEDVFYFNFETRESVWEHPCDEMYRKMVEENRNKPAEPDAKTKGSSDSGSGLGDVDTDEELAEEERKLLESDPRDLEARVHSMMWDTTPNPSPHGHAPGSAGVGALTRGSPVAAGKGIALDKDLQEEVSREEPDKGHIKIDESYSPTLRGGMKRVSLACLKEEDEKMDEQEGRSSASSTPASTPHGAEAAANMEAQQKRLQLISNELSDEESSSRSCTLDDSISSTGSKGTRRSASNGSPKKAKQDLRELMAVSIGIDIGVEDSLELDKCDHWEAVEPCVTKVCDPVDVSVKDSSELERKCDHWETVEPCVTKACLSNRRLEGQRLVGSRFDGGDIRLRHAERHVRHKEQSHGPLHPEVAQALMRVAEHHGNGAASTENAGRAAALQRKQRETLERALRILEAHHGKASAELIPVLTSLAGANEAMGGFQAKQMFLARIASIKAGAGAATSDRGSAGVGLAPSPRVGLTVDTAPDENAEAEDMTEDTIQSSPTSASNTPSQSHSGGRALPAGPGKATPSSRQLMGLEHSGQSWQSKSSNLSEVSEDFPSDFDAASPENTQATWNAPFGDSLELSATAATVEAPLVHKPIQTRIQNVQNDVQSLYRILSALREVRAQQCEYLHGLKCLAEGSPAVVS